MVELESLGSSRRGEPIQEPGVEEEEKVLVDVEGVGDATEVMSPHLGLPALPPLVVAVAGGLRRGQDGEAGLLPHFSKDQLERVDGMAVHGLAPTGRWAEVASV